MRYPNLQHGCGRWISPNQKSNAGVIANRINDVLSAATSGGFGVENAVYQVWVQLRVQHPVDVADFGRLPLAQLACSFLATHFKTFGREVTWVIGVENLLLWAQLMKGVRGDLVKPPATFYFLLANIFI